MSRVGGSWMLAGRPRSAEEAERRGMKCRRLSPEEIAAEAAKLGLPVHQAQDFRQGRRRGAPLPAMESTPHRTPTAVAASKACFAPKGKRAGRPTNSMLR